MGMFIEISVRDDEFLRTAAARGLVEACPVEIFEPVDHRVRVKKEQEDECTLCGRCLEIAGDRIEIIKRYV